MTLIVHIVKAGRAHLLQDVPRVREKMGKSLPVFRKPRLHRHPSCFRNGDYRGMGRRRDGRPPPPGPAAADDCLRARDGSTRIGGRSHAQDASIPRPSTPVPPAGARSPRSDYFSWPSACRPGRLRTTRARGRRRAPEAASRPRSPSTAPRETRSRPCTSRSTSTGGCPSASTTPWPASERSPPRGRRSRWRPGWRSSLRPSSPWRPCPSATCPQSRTGTRSSSTTTRS